MPTANQQPAEQDDQQIRNALLAELESDARLRPSEIEVQVEDGRVMLTGSVDSYLKRWAADRAAHRVAGVRSVANHIAVRLPVTSERTDGEIAAAAVIALESSVGLDAQNISVSVANGIVTLQGAVEWHFERDAAERVIRSLWGVRGVENHLTVRARAILAQLKNEIQRALARTVESEDTRISVDAQQGKVTLRGNARSWADREAAERVTWSASGVTTVENEIVVADQGGERASSEDDSRTTATDGATDPSGTSAPTVPT